jgi:hypothetical protein
MRDLTSHGFFNTINLLQTNKNETLIVLNPFFDQQYTMKGHKKFAGEGMNPPFFIWYSRFARPGYFPVFGNRISISLREYPSRVRSWRISEKKRGPWYPREKPARIPARSSGNSSLLLT